MTELTLELPTFIYLNEAASHYGVRREMLTQLVEDGKIRAGQINGEIAVAQEDVQVLNQRNQLWRQVKHLDGVAISMTAACEKYEEINFASLSRWVARGYIRALGGQKGGGRGNKRLLNEADVAYTALLIRKRGKRPGKRVFSPETFPPHLATT